MHHFSNLPLLRPGRVGVAAVVLALVALLGACTLELSTDGTAPCVEVDGPAPDVEVGSC